MPKKKNPGGHADRQRRGLVGVVVPVTPEVRALLARAALLDAVARPGDRPSLAFWCARVLEEQARAVTEKEEQTP